ncbi:MAG: glycosyltransferase family 4 protein [Planctomycetota bacterium]
MGTIPPNTMRDQAPNPPSSRNAAWPGVGTVTTLGSYLPRRCGIATFTHDLTEAIADAIQHAGSEAQVQSIAMNDRPEGYRYGPRVAFEINENRLAEYRLAADFLNLSPAGVLCLQHEYGIYGGDHGVHVLELMRRLRMPSVATLHTVLKEPNDRQHAVMMQLAEQADRVVVMAERAFEFLTEIYGVPRHKIALIPHGIHDVPFVDPAFYKDQFGVAGKKVILTFGLLSPGKGLEFMIEAMSAIVKQNPDAVYLVLGATHPGILAESGEDYRIGLQQRAKELGVADHIKWFNKFVEIDELLEFLGCADVYVTPYLNEAQITSGTLAYALGAGKATVSTPYWHAQELLDAGRGKLVPFKNSDELAKSVNALFSQEIERHAIRKAAYTHTRPMTWRRVAEQYLDVFAEVREERLRNPRPLIHAKNEPVTPGTAADELPEVKLDHLRVLTDSCGCIAHAKATIPDRDSGYRLDDNARALIATLMAGDFAATTANGTRFDDRLDVMIARYLSFMDHAFDESAGRFKNHMGYDRVWDDEPFSEDTHGRAIRALGETVARSNQLGHRSLAVRLFQAALPACERFEHPHGMAYALIGIHAYLRRYSGDTHAKQTRELLAQRLFDAFSGKPDDWPWPVDQLTYTAARLPHALLLCGRWMFNNAMIQQALKSLDFLNAVQTGDDERFAPVGTHGWFPRGGTKARFDQLPMEAGGAIDANLEAFRVTNNPHYLRRAHRTLQWFLGDNDLRQPLYDQTTGGCFDKLTAQGVDENQSADATISWLLSLMSMHEHALAQDQPATAVNEPVATTPDAATNEQSPKPIVRPGLTPTPPRTPAG